MRGRLGLDLPEAHSGSLGWSSAACSDIISCHKSLWSLSGCGPLAVCMSVLVGLWEIYKCWLTLPGPPRHYDHPHTQGPLSGGPDSSEGRQCGFTHDGMATSEAAPQIFRRTQRATSEAVPQIFHPLVRTRLPEAVPQIFGEPDTPEAVPRLFQC